MASSCPQVGPGRVVAEPVQAATLVAAQEGIDRDVIIRLYEAAHAASYSVSQLTPSGIGDHLVVRALRSRCQHLLTMVLWHSAREVAAGTLAGTLAMFLRRDLACSSISCRDGMS